MSKEVMVIATGPYGDHIGLKRLTSRINVVAEIPPQEQIKLVTFIERDNSVPKKLKAVCVLTLQQGSVPENTIGSKTEGIATYIFNRLRQLRTPATDNPK